MTQRRCSLVCGRELFISSLSDLDKEDPRFKISPQLTDSDRQLLFADFVIELQAAEDDKRRRIRDARRRAEKAQREAYRDVLKRLAVNGIIRPYTRWRSVEEFVASEDAFAPVLAQDRDAPRELFEEYVDEWDDLYRRERAFLSRLVGQADKKDIVVKPDTTLDDFTKLLLKEAEYSQDIYADTRRIINREDPVSTARLYLEELVSIASNSGQRSTQRRAVQEDSSEDEGEIIEEGEMNDDEAAAPPNLEPAPDEGESDDAHSNGGTRTTNGVDEPTSQDNTDDSLENNPPVVVANDGGSQDEGDT